MTEEEAKWFATGPKNGLSKVFASSSVKAFVDAEEYYADLREAVEKTGEGGLICWIGFEASANTPMPKTASESPTKAFPPRKAASDVTWFDLLKAASDTRSVAIRVLLNLHPAPDLADPANPKYKGANLDLVGSLNGLKNCGAINDFRYLWLNGTHHQKLVLVYDNKRLVAYCGTCDVAQNRITHSWCEVQCKITGDAAGELYEIFHRRWAEHTERLARMNSRNTFLRDLATMNINAAASGQLLVQTGTTYGNPGRESPFRSLIAANFSAMVHAAPEYQSVNLPHVVEVDWKDPSALPIGFQPRPVVRFGNDFFTGKEAGASDLLKEASKQSQTYAFAPTGHTGIYEMIKRAIANTTKFIYMEDQYLVCDESMGTIAPVLDLLVAKLKEPKFKKLIILCTRMDDINEDFQMTGWKHRKNFISALKAAGKNKVDVCQYKSQAQLANIYSKPHEAIFYVHSKTWIFDDEFLVTGSANCNRRGYSHDSELDVAVYDRNKSFVRDFRVRLWKKRLNTAGIKKSALTDGDLKDFMSAATYWEFPAEWGLVLENEWSASFAPTKHPDLDLKSYEAWLAGKKGIGPELARYVDKLKMKGLWDVVVDPEGT